jgi:hypothetical protein
MNHILFLSVFIYPLYSYFLQMPTNENINRDILSITFEALAPQSPEKRIINWFASSRILKQTILWPLLHSYLLITACEYYYNLKSESNTGKWVFFQNLVFSAEKADRHLHQQFFCEVALNNYSFACGHIPSWTC